MGNIGYTGEALNFLEANNITVWSRVEITFKTGTKILGIILPGLEQSDKYIYIKLPNGYNIAVSMKKIASIKLIEKLDIKYEIPEVAVKQKTDLPRLLLLGAGGTIASRVEYETGAVKPAFSERELLNAVPELYDVAVVEALNLFNIFSEDMKPEYWITLAKRIHEIILKEDYRGVVITHGTDTMHYTASALSFMLQNLPVPIVLTGAQRSSDRPASDSAVNLIASAITATRSEIGEVMIVMHASLDDETCYAHRGVRARKMHSSRRDAFKTIGDEPLAEITISNNNYKFKYLKTDFKRIASNKEDFKLYPYFENKTALIYVYPNFSKEIIETLIDHKYKGIVLAGTGLGHVPEDLLDTISRGVNEGVLFAMTTQCIWGPVGMNVYERGRKLQKLGVIPANGMLPETAYVKLGWVLGLESDHEKVKELFLKNIANEILLRENLKSYIC